MFIVYLFFILIVTLHTLTVYVPIITLRYTKADLGLQQKALLQVPTKVNFFFNWTNLLVNRSLLKRTRGSIYFIYLRKPANSGYINLNRLSTQKIPPIVRLSLARCRENCKATNL